MDEITLYKRYRQQKYCCELEDSAFLGGLVGIFLTAALRPFELLQTVDLRPLIGHPFVTSLLGATVFITVLVIVFDACDQMAPSGLYENEQVACLSV